MSDEMDPEVFADLQLRARTERTRPPVPLEALRFEPSPVIDRVPCRGRCGNVADWTEDAEERFKIFNRELARRMDAPLDKTRIVFCEKCKARGLAMTAQARRTQVDQLAAVIKELKTKDYPEGETKLIEKIKELGHPDVEGMLQAMRTRLDGKNAGGRKPRKDSL